MNDVWGTHVELVPCMTYNSSNVIVIVMIFGKLIMLKRHGRGRERDRSIVDVRWCCQHFCLAAVIIDQGINFRS